MALVSELDPAVDEAAFLVPTVVFAGCVGGGRFGGKEELGYGTVGGEKGADCWGLHEGGGCGKGRRRLVWRAFWLLRVF